MQGSPYKPKVFISHSTKADERAGRFLDLLHQRLVDAKNKDGTEAFEVWSDRTLDIGVKWRDILDEWICHCDAAIILLSDAATHSNYVKMEVALLQKRPELMLLPVSFPSVTDEDLKQRMEPQQITERQIRRLTEDNDDEILEELLSNLSLISDRIPRHKIEEELFDLFCYSIADGQLKGIIDALAIGRVPLIAQRDRAQMIVRALLEAEIETGSLRFHRLRRVLERLHMTLDRPRRSELLDMVFPFCWVNAEAAGKLPDIAARTPRTRAVAWTREWNLSERMYLLRGFCHPRIYPIYVSNLDGGINKHADDQNSFLDHLVSCLHQELCHRPPKGSFEEVKKKLCQIVEEREQEGEPVFLLIPLEAVDKERVQLILDEFPKVTLFFYSESLTQNDFADLEFPSADFLTPPLHPDAEHSAYAEYGRLLKLIGEPLDKLNNPQSLAR